MSRLSDKLAQAGGIVARQSKAIEDRADALIAREAVIQDRTNKAFSGHETWIDSTNKDLDALEKQLELLNNAAPLDSSSTGSAPPQAIPGGGVGGNPPPDPFKPTHPLPTDKDGRIIG